MAKQEYKPGDIVRYTFFYQRFPDRDESRNRFEVMSDLGLSGDGDGSEQKHRFIIQMLAEPNKRCDVGEDEIDPAT